MAAIFTAARYLLDPRALLIFMLMATLAYSHVKAYKAGGAKVRSEWAAQIASDEIRTASRLEEVSRDHAERLVAAQTASIENEIALKKELDNAQISRKKLVDDLVAGRVRIKPFIDNSNPGISASPIACVGDNESAGLRERVARTVALGEECTAERDALRRELMSRQDIVNKK